MTIIMIIIMLMIVRLITMTNLISFPRNTKSFKEHYCKYVFEEFDQSSFVREWIYKLPAQNIFSVTG